MRSGSCVPVTEGKHAGAADAKEGKWHVGLHCERFQVQEQGCVVAIIQGLGEATPRLLCAVLVSFSEEGCSCSPGNAAKVYQADSGDVGTDV